MTLSQLVAKLIDLEIEHGDTPVLVRDNNGDLKQVGTPELIFWRGLDYIDIEPKIT